MALQGSLIGLITHGMKGFDYDSAKEVLHVSDDFQVAVEPDTLAMPIQKDLNMDTKILPFSFRHVPSTVSFARTGISEKNLSMAGKELYKSL